MGDLNFKFEDHGACYATLGCLGDRDSMEDTAKAQKNMEGLDVPTIYGVYDGHGGAQCATYCADHMADALASHPKINIDPKEAIFDAFMHVDDQYCSLAEKHNFDDGATATLLYVCPDTIQSKKKKSRVRFFLAAAGECRAILVKQNGDVIELSKEHTCDRKDEEERVKRLGAEVVFNGDRKMLETDFAMLSLTRAIGDRAFKPYVTAEPEIYEGYLTKEEDAFVVLASDGLWGQVENDEVGKFLLNQDGKLAPKVKKLIMVAKERDNDMSKKYKEAYSCDNVTITVVEVPTLVSKMLKAVEAKENEKEIAIKKLEI